MARVTLKWSPAAVPAVGPTVPDSAKIALLHAGTYPPTASLTFAICLGEEAGG